MEIENLHAITLNRAREQALQAAHNIDSLRILYLPVWRLLWMA